MTSLLRSLQEEEEDYQMLETSNDGTFDARVFWGVNCFIALLVGGMCLWCFYFNKVNLAGWSDRQFQATVRDRHERRMAARRGTPAKRAARLKQSFVRHKVQMVVKEGDIILEDDMSQPCEYTMQESITTPPNVEAEVSKDSEVEEPSAPTERPSAPCESESAAVAMEEGIETPKVLPGARTIEQSTVDTMSMSSSISDHPTGYLLLRPGDTPKPPPNNNPKMVPNCCAVCLGAYEINDVVVWSCNPDCAHAFHRECILEWLLKIHDGGTPCPCCRQEFTSWETDRQERKIKWAAGHTFDVRAVSLR